MKNLKNLLLVFLAVFCFSSKASAKPYAVFIGDSRTVGVSGGWNKGKSAYNSDRYRTITVSKAYANQLFETQKKGDVTLLREKNGKYVLKIRSTCAHNYTPSLANQKGVSDYIRQFVDIRYIMAENGEHMKHFFGDINLRIASLNNILNHCNIYRKGAYIFFILGHNDIAPSNSQMNLKNKADMYMKGVNNLAKKYRNLKFIVVPIYDHANGKDLERTRNFHIFNSYLKSTLRNVKIINIDKINEAVANEIFDDQKIYDDDDSTHAHNISFKHFYWDVIWSQARAF